MNLISWLIIPAFFLTLLYVAFQLLVLKVWQKSVKNEALTPDFDPENQFVSLIIAARNEEDNIGKCLASISYQDLPSEQFEVILVNDHSEDDTLLNAQSAQLSNLTIYTLPSGLHGKKDAIRFGISKSKGTYLLFTDADCLLPISWIRSMRDYMISGDLDAVCAPVLMEQNERTILTRFQQIDNMGMMAVSATAINGNYFTMANGANLGIKRSILTNKDIEWNDRFASGDDMALINHVQNSKGRIAFFPNRKTTVVTGTEPNWTAFINQRLRWGTKNKSSGQLVLITIAGIAYLAALSHVIALVLFVVYLFGFLGTVPVWLWGFLLLKPLIDTLTFYRLRSFFQMSLPLMKIPFYSILHSFYLTIVGSLSLIPVEYRWKGRRLK